MMDSKRISDLYNALRAVGPVSAEEVPTLMTAQTVNAGLYNGDEKACRSALSSLSKVASTSSLSEFEIEISSRSEVGQLLAGQKLQIKPAEAVGLQAGAAGPAVSVDSCEGGCD